MWPPGSQPALPAARRIPMLSETCDKALGAAWAGRPAGQCLGSSGVSPQPSSHQAPSSFLLLCLCGGCPGPGSPRHYSQDPRLDRVLQKGATINSLGPPKDEASLTLPLGCRRIFSFKKGGHDSSQGSEGTDSPDRGQAYSLDQPQCRVGWQQRCACTDTQGAGGHWWPGQANHSQDAGPKPVSPV